MMYLKSSNLLILFYFFFFNDTATTEIYTLSLHDALPISALAPNGSRGAVAARDHATTRFPAAWRSRPDRKSTRLNSSHSQISYAVFCLKKKKQAGPRHNPARSSLRFSSAGLQCTNSS